jgi:uncharacterized protein
MYMLGNSPVMRTSAQLLLDRVSASRERMVTSAEVFQEILHRYNSIQRRDVIDPAFRLLLETVDKVLPITEGDIMRAREVLLSTAGLSARDALHIAVMERHSVGRILSFDAGFDRWPGIERVYQL